MLEIINEDWFEKLTLKSGFKVRGLSIGDSEDGINKDYSIKTFDFSNTITSKIYRCPNLKYNYKVKNGIIIGLGMKISNLTEKQFRVKYGAPNSKEPVIGQISSVEFYDIDGYDLVYDNFRIVLSNNLLLDSIQFGEKIFEDE
tara:strand:- start:95 stop:523 length:429 start_codon:yes stop_codon:yes gene_type:complete